MTGGRHAPRRRPAPRPSAFSNALTFGWRAVLKFKHVPEQLFDLVMTPIMFTLLFTFVFGGALAGSTDDYLQFFLPGILVQTVIFNAVYSGMGLSTDLQGALRPLPVAADLVARALRGADGGRRPAPPDRGRDHPRDRPRAGLPARGGGAGRGRRLRPALAIGFGTGWAFIVLGLLVRTPTTVMTLGFTVLFPVVFASNIMVDPATMPGWLRAFVEVNPVSHMATAMRQLFAGTAGAASSRWRWSLPVAMTAGLAPVVLWLYRGASLPPVGGAPMTLQETLHYFRWAFIVTAVGLGLGGLLGWQMTGTVSGTLSVFVVVAVLAVLEISLSFDNAIVNANKLKTMRPEWQRRFLTWGILIAVFGMRILFPLLIVVIAAKIGPIQAVVLAAVQPEEYARIMHDAHLPIAAFGGTFLMMVGLSFFFDHEKDVHWVRWLEMRMADYATIRGIEVAVVLVLILVFSRFLPPGETVVFVNAAIWGLLTFLLVEVLGGLLDRSQETLKGAAQGGVGAFLYLEVLDASFSFDGVIGAFALSQNLFIIAIGLGIGAMYVRSMTIMLVEKGTLAQYRLLEHGAFYAILALSVIMYAQALVHIPEVITGLGGAALIGVSLWSSIRWNRKTFRPDLHAGGRLDGPPALWKRPGDRARTGEPA
jgi:uncharacterized protein